MYTSLLLSEYLFKRFVLALTWIVYDYAVIQSCVQLKCWTIRLKKCMYFSICTAVYFYIYGTSIAVHILELYLYSNWYCIFRAQFK